MDEGIVQMIYHAFLGGGFVRCLFDGTIYELCYVEDHLKTELYIKLVAGRAELSVLQSVPGYPVLDAKGNAIHFEL
jgi:hypothetical protein